LQLRHRIESLCSHGDALISLCCGGAQQEGENLAADSHQFVSSVCWSHKGHTLLAANSQGTLKLLELD
jgi:hypothetical protein